MFGIWNYLFTFFLVKNVAYESVEIPILFHSYSNLIK